MGDDQRGAALHQAVERLLHGRARSRRRARWSPRRAAGWRDCAGWRGRWRCAGAGRPTGARRASPRKVSKPCGSASMKSSAEAAWAAARDLGVAGLGPAVADVVGHRGGEQHRLLRHDRHARRAGRRRRARGCRRRRALTAPDFGIVEAQQQVEHGGLAGARGADDGDRLARRDLEVEAVERQRLGPRGIAERHLLEAHGAAGRLGQRHRLRPARRWPAARRAARPAARRRRRRAAGRRSSR